MKKRHYALLFATLASLVACVAPQGPRLADPEVPPQSLQPAHLLTIVRAPAFIEIDHSVVLPVPVDVRRLPLSFDLAALARSYIDAELATRRPSAAVTHLAVDHPDALAVLNSKCIDRRAREVSAACAVLLRDVAARHRADTVLVVDDWAGRGLLGIASRTRAGLGLQSYRTQTKALKVIAYSHLGVQVVVLGLARSFVGPPCHEDGTGVYEFDAETDADKIDPAQLQWLERDLSRRLERSLDRALGRSGVIDLNPAACADPDNENRTFDAPSGLFGG